jgi:hypothetical protein
MAEVDLDVSTQTYPSSCALDHFFSRFSARTPECRPQIGGHLLASRVRIERGGQHVAILVMILDSEDSQYALHTQRELELPTSRLHRKATE